MKFLIAGDTTRGRQWERYLRIKPSVKEVIIASVVQNENVDAVILLDNSTSNLDTLLELIRKGYPVFLVSDLPLTTHKLEQIYHASEESNVSVQFSLWPAFTELTRWIRKNTPESPLLIDIQKTVKSRSIPDPLQFNMAWAEELAFILTLQKSHIQNISVLPVRMNNKLAGIHLTLRFNSGALGALRYNAISPGEVHQRIIHSGESLYYCNIIDNTATRYSKGMDSASLLKSESESFNSEKTVHHAIDSFIRSLKTHKQSGFSAFDALQTAQLADRITKQMKLF